MLSGPNNYNLGTFNDMYSNVTYSPNIFNIQALEIEGYSLRICKHCRSLPRYRINESFQG